MLNLKLERPLIFFDLETTGVSIQKDRIVEISVVKIMPDGTRDIKTRKVNPEMPIPPGASAVHGIYDDDVKDEPVFKQIARSLFNYMENCDIGGYNILKFDIPLLTNEYKRAGLDFSVEGRNIIDAFNIFCKMEPRTLSAAYEKYCGKELQNAHSAEADTLATFDVFCGQLEYYKDDMPQTLSEISEYFNKRDDSWIDGNGRFKWQGEEAMVGFGKHNGQLLKNVALENPGFLKWIINNDFPEDAKKVAREALNGTFPQKKSS